MIRIESQPAYILHTRPYRDTSLIVEFLTADHGRVSGVLKGIRSTAKAAKRRRGATQPFIPLSISWTGKSELKTIIEIEHRQAPIALQGQRLFSALYINELLTRILQRYDTHTELYSLYEWVLNSLLTKPVIESVLRHFEFQLLEYLGYGIDFTVDVDSAEVISVDASYRFHPDRGFALFLVGGVEPPSEISDIKELVFKGSDILDIAKGSYTPSAHRAAKQICRQALKVHLGDNPLKSRELFI